MSNKKDSEEVSRQVNQQIRQAKHGRGYYIALFLLIFVIPLYVLLQFFYVDAGGWEPFDLFFLLALIAFSIYGLYTDHALKTKLPVWFIVLGVISVIFITILQILIM
jgi:hypothetical protein